ncbi:hypothetical protein VPH35_129624 [Triticum aestivum]
MVGRWFPGRKTRHDHEAGPSSDRHRRSPTPPPPPPPSPAFHIASGGALTRRWPYVKAEVCQRYWETRTLLPWGDVHFPNNWHLIADRVHVPPVPVSGRARREETHRRCARLPRTSSTTRGSRPHPYAVAVPATPRAGGPDAAGDGGVRPHHDERQWEGIEEMLALSAARDVAFPELDAYVKEEAMQEARPEVAMEEQTGWNPALVEQS